MCKIICPERTQVHQGVRRLLIICRNSLFYDFIVLNYNFKYIIKLPF